jgi:hypothetical protein
MVMNFEAVTKNSENGQKNDPPRKTVEGHDTFSDLPLLACKLRRALFKERFRALGFVLRRGADAK